MGDLYMSCEKKALNGIEMLKNFSVISSLGDQELKSLEEKLIFREYTRGETIFMEGEAGESMFFLQRGRVKISKTSSSGKEQILKFIEPGEVFGEVVLFGVDGYPATTICEEDSCLAVLTRKKFRNFFLNHPEIGWGLLENMAEKLYFSQRRIKSLGLQNSRSRIAQALLEMLETGEGDKEISEINQEELARYLGITRETVSRNISRMKEEGLIDIRGRSVIVCDREGLEDLG